MFNSTLYSRKIKTMEIQDSKKAQLEEFKKYYLEKMVFELWLEGRISFGQKLERMGSWYK